MTTPNGVLSDAHLTWIDESSPNIDILTKLAGNVGIVNFSARMPDQWSSLQSKARSSWTPSLFVAAAHNKDEHTTLTPEKDAEENEDGMPIAWHLPNIIGVGVADVTGKTADKVLKSYERDQVDLLAPGYLVPAVGPVPDNPVCIDGTSFATAYVSAVAALLQEQAHGMLTSSQLRARLLATASWKPEYWDHVKGGLINAGRALDGLFENLLTFTAQGDATKPGLQVSIRFRNEQFKATGEEFGSTTPQTLPVFWTDVLRLTRIDETVDAAGRTQAMFYMAFVNGGRYQVWKNVTINSAPSAMPITQCKRRTDNVQITCSAADVNTIFDYIAQRYQVQGKDAIKVF